MIALCLLGIVLFNPPLVRVFGVERTVLGLPLIYVYLFAAWALLIGLMAWFADPSLPNRGITAKSRGKSS